MDKQACLDEYNRVGVAVNDTGVFEVHESFSSSEYAAISAFGIAALAMPGSIRKGINWYNAEY